MAQYDQVKLLSLDAEFLAALIRQHLHVQDGDPDLWKLLASEAIRGRTAAALKGILRDVREEIKKKAMEHQALRIRLLKQGGYGRRAWDKADAEHQAWKTRRGEFLIAVEHRLGSIKDPDEGTREQMLARRARRLSANEARYRDAVQALAVRIHQHQALTARSSREPEQHDYDLWRLLDELTVPLGDDNAPVPLRRMLRAYWFETTPATVREGETRTAERMMRQAPAGRSQRYGGTPKARHIGNPGSLA